MTTLNSECVTDDAGLQRLRPAWEALWRAARDPGPFQSPHWLLPWWRIFGKGRQPIVATLSSADRLLGLLPLYLLASPSDEGGTRILPIGAGITDYQDALLTQDAPSDAASRLLQAALVEAERQGAPICDLTDLRPGSVLRRAAVPMNWHAAWSDTDPCPVLRLEGAAKLRDVVPPRMHRKLRMNRHRANRRGGWKIETARDVTLDRALDMLIRLHEARWKAGGVLADPLVATFHCAALPGLFTAGLARLTLLHIGAEPAAVFYTLLHPPDRELFYIGGFDPAQAHESPGTILLGAMIERAIAEGQRELHFLRGGEAYKYGWGATARNNAALRLSLRR